MVYTNSPLVSYTRLTNNYWAGRKYPLTRITPHCVVGQCSVETLGNVFYPASRQASCNYGIGSDGRIGMYVEEKNSSWCSSSYDNDNRGITVEVASDTTHPYAMKDAAYQSLIKLCADICKRNGKKKLLWLGTKEKALAYQPKDDEMVLTAHRFFKNKACVPVDTEVLTRDGWVKIGDIQIGDEIACADINNLRMTFEEVYDKIPEREQDTYTNNGFTATKDHRCIYHTQYNEVYRIDDYKHLLASGQQIYFPLAGYSNFEGMPLTDDELRFLVAVQADGHYMHEARSANDPYFGLEFHLKKDRKIERIKNLLEACHFDYTESHKSDGSVSIRVYGKEIVEECEKYLQDKHFTWEWIMLSPHQAKVFLNEVQFWDGCVAADLYTSKEQINLDVVNAIAALNGVGSRVSGSNVYFRETPFVTLGKGAESTKRNARQKNLKQTRVTCVSVKTGVFLIRQNGKTFLTGNCPGDWLYSRFGELADKVNALLNSSSSSSNKTTTTTTTATPVATNSSDNESKIWNFLKGKGLNDYAVAGVMGNLYAESALNPKNLQNSYEKKLGYTDATYTTAVDNGRYTNFVKDSAGYGLAQWTYWSRKQNLYNYAKKVGKSIGDLDMQLDFLWNELNGYSKVMAQLKAAKSVLEASNAMLLGFEKPADQSASVQSRRAGYGQTYYNKYAGKKVETVTTTPSTAQTETPKQTTTSTETKVSSTIYRVQTGAFGVKANADKQLAKVKAAGFTNAILAYDGKLYRVQVGAYAVQQNAINMCFKVKKAGFTDAFVSTAGGINTNAAKKSVDEIAKEVIQGKWGNGAARKKALEAAGYNYSAVQAKVSALMSK